MYAWSDPRHLEEMFTTLLIYLKKVFVQRQDLTQVATKSCRFHTVWPEHVGLTNEDNAANLYIATFLGNMLEGHAQVIRMLVNNLIGISIEAFGKEICLKDAANLFPTQNTQNMLGFQQQQRKGDFRKGGHKNRQGHKHWCKHWGGCDYPDDDVQYNRCFR